MKSQTLCILSKINKLLHTLVKPIVGGGCCELQSDYFGYVNTTGFVPETTNTYILGETTKL